MSRHTINPTDFVARMAAHWTSPRDQGGLGNHSSSELETVWRIICQSFNEQILEAVSDRDYRWRIVQPATGSGKTQSLAVYCSMLARERPHVGVLAVVRMKEQANELAETINRLAADQVALPRHSDNKIDPDDMKCFQVLVITHKAFELLMDRTACSALEAFTQWERGRRRLTVIDESLDLVVEAQVDLDAVRKLGNIPTEVLEEHPEAARTIRHIEGALQRLDRRPETGDGTSCITWPGLQEVSAGRSTSGYFKVSEVDLRAISGLRRACRDVDWDTWVANRRSNDFKASIRREVDKTLYAIEQVIRQWNYFSREGNRRSLNTARLVVPEFIKGAVVLDATASQNLLWHLFEERAELVSLPVNPRRYDKVRLHVLRENGLGKHAMIKRVDDTLVQKVVAGIARHGTDRKVLVVTNKAVEPKFAVASTPFEAWKTAHWGAIDGRNDWNAFDTVLLFGLKYLPWSNSANLYFALRGVQDDRWLNDPEARRYRPFQDIRKAIRHGQLAVDMIQAINRVRCRRVIDAAGNCPKTDVFLVVPEDETGDHILGEIHREMPGLKRAKWDYQSRKERLDGRRDYAAGLIKYLEAQPLGHIPAAEVQETLGCSRSTWSSLAQACKGEAPSNCVYHGLDEQLASLGITYFPGGRGKGNAAYFDKRSAPPSSAAVLNAA